MSESRMIVAAGLMAFLLLLPGHVLAQQDPSRLDDPQPPPISSHYLQYGVALTGQVVSSTGSFCPGIDTTECVLRSGGGLAIRAGYRSRSRWYFGGAYESSRQDSGNLIRLAILQQLRAEFRGYWTRATRLSPYVSGSAGAVAYGNEWAADIGGATGSLGGGVEIQLTRRIVLHWGLEYRGVLLRRWQDGLAPGVDLPSGFGLAHLVSLEAGFSIRNPLARW